MTILSSIIEGFAMGAGLIIAIGAQNAFVLKQGIKGEHRPVIAWICALSDAFLIISGIAGMGYIFSTHPVITKAVSLAGSVYLAWFSFRCFRSAVKGESMDINGGVSDPLSLKKTVITTLALTYLNPHVYLDTVVMLGGFGAARSPEIRPFFALGAVSASFTWFFTLAYSGKILSPLFKRQVSWRILDTVIGFVMIYITVKLVLFG
ncbi:MAG TPA: LysE/ArgO family amino acid transporter, partial [Spirochaetota bacterium]|nr:LysE/ArgO family amino acid transporter [Spirochaetota bacterium]HPS87941.1 LysE/ArgO family amino acid transporter [Spirochaetota bacterium]